MNTRTPPPRDIVANPDLWRPDWTRADGRSAAMLHLDKNENPDPAMAELVGRVVAEVAPATYASYPDAAALYGKLAGKLGLGPENLRLAAGSDGVIGAVFQAYVAPGDVVIHTQPTFAMYGVYCQIFGARARPLAYRPSNGGPALNVDDVIHGIETEAPRLVCLPNPDSPTGTVFSQPEMRRIIAAARDAGAMMLVDEAYYPFHDETVLPWVTEFPNLVVTRSTGKAWALAGFRIGYGAASAEVAANLHKIRPMYEAGAMSVAVFERMLDFETEMMASVARLEAGKNGFLDAMEALGFRTLRGKGNFLHVAFGTHADAVHAALADMVHYRKDFNEPCLKGFSRFSAATPAQFAPVIERIREAVTRGGARP